MIGDTTSPPPPNVFFDPNVFTTVCQNFELLHPKCVSEVFAFYQSLSSLATRDLKSMSLEDHGRLFVVTMGAAAATSRYLLADSKKASKLAELREEQLRSTEDWNRTLQNAANPAPNNRMESDEQ